MKKWLRVMLTADFFAILSIAMLTPIYAIFVQKIGGDILEASGAWTAFSLTSGILIYFISKWEDKDKHYGRMVFTGYLTRSFAFLGYMMVQNIWHLFGVQVMLGISFAVALPSYDCLYSTYLQKGKYATEWGTWESMDMIVSAIGAMAGGLVASKFGFNTLFLAMFVIAIIGTVVSFPLMSRKARKAAKLKP